MCCGTIFEALQEKVWGRSTEAQARLEKKNEKLETRSYEGSFLFIYLFDDSKNAVVKVEFLCKIFILV